MAENMTFTGFMNVIVELFGVLYTTGTLLISWLTTPLSELAGDEFADFLGSMAVYTPFELMFGSGLLVVLVIAIVRFLTSALPG